MAHAHSDPFFSNSLVNWNYGVSILENYKNLMSAYTNNEEFKSGALNDYSSSNVICFNRLLVDNNAWCLLNTRNVIFSFILPLELQNFSGINLLDGSSFSINVENISLNPLEILVFK